MRGYYRYYLGDNSGSNIDYAPTDFRYGTYPFVWGNFASGPINREPVALGLVATNNSTSGTKSYLKTKGGVKLVKRVVPRAPLAHTYTLYVVATDALGQRDSQKLRLTVRP